jgi:S-adenosylmethionine synthetase
MTNFRTAETVSPGHPDKIADLISDHVLTNALKTNKKSKVAVETFLTGTKEGGLVVVGGEISDIAEITDDKVNAIVKDALSKTIKTSFEDFDLDNLNIMNVLTPQSEEIRSAVEDDEDLGAGDQGIMVGFASDETDSKLPKTFDYSRQIQKELWDLQHASAQLDLDSKVQVTTGGDVVKVVVSTQHQIDIDLANLFEEVSSIVSEIINEEFKLDLNPSGSFVKGGPAGDTGLTGRKIVVDAYGPTVPVGGGAFSGKDPSKVDRSAAYAARHLAKNIVDHGLSKKCLVRVSYAIGKAEPYELTVDTFNTLNVDESVLNDFVSKFDMKPGAIIERLNLLDVDYTTDTLFSHFGTEGRNWEQKEDI